jgi:hypothetical protein
MKFNMEYEIVLCLYLTKMSPEKIMIYSNDDYLKPCEH